MSPSTSGRRAVVLARRDHGEALRAAGGLTLSGLGVDLVVMDRPLQDTPANRAHAELIELTGVQVSTTVAAMAADVPLLDEAALAQLLAGAHAVISL